MNASNKDSKNRGRDGVSAIAQRAERRKNRGKGMQPDWGSVDAETLLRLVSACTADGTLISFGYTKDGGAYVVGFFKDGDRANEYCRPNEDINQFLADIAEDYGT